MENDMKKVFAILLFLFSLPAFAQLTTAQQTTLRNYVVNNSTLNAIPHTSDGGVVVAAALNTPTASYYVTRSSVQTSQVGTNVLYTAIGALSTNNLTQLQVFVQLNPQVFVPTADVQAFFATTFTGTLAGGGAQTRANMVMICQRLATLAESLLATGSGTTGSPSILGWEGSLSWQDVMSAMSWY